MSSELERRLEGLLAETPEPDHGAGEEALHRALRALQPAAPSHRGLRTAVLVFAAAAVLLAIAAGSLAAAGALHVSFGPKPKPKPRPVSGPLSLPKGASGVAALVDGRLLVVTKDGSRLQGPPATAVTLSPHALFVAAGIGHSLVAMAPDGRRVWSHPAHGEVVAIAWAPDAIRIAYVVRVGRRYALNVIWGIGTHDRTIDRSVRAVRPSWRADSLALAYVGAGGKAVAYDLGHNRHGVLGSAAPITSVAFAPSGKTLLAATPGSVLLGGKRVATGEVEAIGWLHGRPAAALEQGVRPPLVRTFGASGRPARSFRVPGRVIGLTGNLIATRSLLGVRPAASVEDLAID
jgi:hypothetical protein